MTGTRLTLLRDLGRDVVIETHARRSRSILMLFAVALSTGTLLTSVFVSAVAARQIDADLAASTLDLITVSVVPAPDGTGGAGLPGPAEELPPDAEERASALDLVTAAGRRLDPEGLTTVALARDEAGQVDGGLANAVTLVGLSSGYLEANRTQAPVSRAWMLDHDDAVVFLGADAARALDIPVSGDPTGLGVWINGERHAVVGFLADGTADLSDAVAIPYRRALTMVGTDAQSQLLVRTAVGAGSPVAGVIQEAIRPDAPERLSASQVADVSTLREGVSTQLGRLAAWIGAFLLVLTVLLIANSMVVSVMARTSEIGLRRALGSSRAQVAATFLAEGGLIGLLGGLTGSALSAGAVVVIAAVNRWSVDIVVLQVALGPAIGVVVGLAASLYPALRGAAIEPAIAVRSD